MPSGTLVRVQLGPVEEVPFKLWTEVLASCGSGPWYCYACAMQQYDPQAQGLPLDQPQPGVKINPPMRRLRLKGCKGGICWECKDRLYKAVRPYARRCPRCALLIEHPAQVEPRNWDEEPIPEDLLEGLAARLAEQRTTAAAKRTAEGDLEAERLGEAIANLPSLLRQQEKLRVTLQRDHAIEIYSMAMPLFQEYALG